VRCTHEQKMSEQSLHEGSYADAIILETTAGITFDLHFVFGCEMRLKMHERYLWKKNTLRGLSGLSFLVGWLSAVVAVGLEESSGGGRLPLFLC
jgi:hypothetical protein